MEGVGTKKENKNNKGTNTMKVKVEEGCLVITIPLNKPPRPSKTGKTLVVASTYGNVQTEAVVDGKHVFLGLNAYIK